MLGIWSPFSGIPGWVKESRKKDLQGAEKNTADGDMATRSFDREYVLKDTLENGELLKKLNSEFTEIDESVDTVKVEKQNYYYRNGIHVKDVITQIYQFFGEDLTSWEATCIYNIMKYLMRYKYKGCPKSDLDKLLVNVNWLKQEIIEE